MRNIRLFVLLSFVTHSYGDGWQRRDSDPAFVQKITPSNDRSHGWKWWSDVDFWRNYSSRSAHGTWNPFDEDAPSRVYGVVWDKGNAPKPDNGWELYERRLLKSDQMLLSENASGLSGLAVLPWFSLYNRSTSTLRFFVDVSEYQAQQGGFKQAILETKIISSSSSSFASSEKPIPTNLFQLMSKSSSGGLQPSSVSLVGYFPIVISEPPAPGKWYCYDLKIAYDPRLKTGDYLVWVSISGQYEQKITLSGTYSGLSSTSEEALLNQSTAIIPAPLGDLGTYLNKGIGISGKVASVAQSVGSYGGFLSEVGARMKYMTPNEEYFSKWNTDRDKLFSGEISRFSAFSKVETAGNELKKIGGSIAGAIGKFTPYLSQLVAGVDFVNSFFGSSETAPTITYERGTISLAGFVTSSSQFNTFSGGLSGTNMSLSRTFPYYSKTEYNRSLGGFRMLRVPKVRIVAIPKAAVKVWNEPNGYFRNVSTDTLFGPAKSNLFGAIGSMGSGPGLAVIPLVNDTGARVNRDGVVFDANTDDNEGVHDLGDIDLLVFVENTDDWIETNPADEKTVMEGFAIASIAGKPSKVVDFYPANRAISVGITAVNLEKISSPVIKLPVKGSIEGFSHNMAFVLDGGALARNGWVSPAKVPLKLKYLRANLQQLGNNGWQPSYSRVPEVYTIDVEATLEWKVSPDAVNHFKYTEGLRPQPVVRSKLDRDYTALQYTRYEWDASAPGYPLKPKHSMRYKAFNDYEEESIAETVYGTRYRVFGGKYSPAVNENCAWGDDFGSCIMPGVKKLYGKQKVYSDAPARLLMM